MFPTIKLTGKLTKFPTIQVKFGPRSSNCLAYDRKTKKEEKCGMQDENKNTYVSVCPEK